MMAKLAEQLILGLDVASTRRRRGQDIGVASRQWSRLKLNVTCHHSCTRTAAVAEEEPIYTAKTVVWPSGYIISHLGQLSLLPSVGL